MALCFDFMSTFQFLNCIVRPSLRFRYSLQLEGYHGVSVGELSLPRHNQEIAIAAIAIIALCFDVISTLLFILHCESIITLPLQLEGCHGINVGRSSLRRHNGGGIGSLYASVAVFVPRALIHGCSQEAIKGFPFSLYVRLSLLQIKSSPGSS